MIRDKNFKCVRSEKQRRRRPPTSSWYFLPSSATSCCAFSHSSFSFCCSRWYFSCHHGNRGMKRSAGTSTRATTICRWMFGLKGRDKFGAPRGSLTMDLSPRAADWNL